MGKHEIRLRRQRLTARGSDRFRNYGAVLKQHGEEKRIKLVTRIFTFLFLIIALIVVFIVISRWEKRHNEPQPKTSTIEITSKIT
ncbi:MAG: hypothetical protein KBF45_06905 [Cyclobacteriaceae bacterium]|jgi:preprotein translocase subunit SecG|nr:hypothetical protein [Cyclobacteriaceae bacterium]